jgi:trk system potassium uptake protein
MQFAVVIRTLGVLVLLFCGSLLPPLLVSLIYQDQESGDFLVTIAVGVITGIALYMPLSRADLTIRNRDGFFIVALTWAAMSLLGSLPFMFGLDMGFADAYFESASGFTTTGATVITHIDGVAPSILFYRQETQWLGGIGVVVAAVALLPMLGIGGMQLYKAETPGPMKDEKLTPRITHAARWLYTLYLWFTLACALCFWLAGMEPFDAIAHALTTLSTGGYSTHDASIAYFDSPAIEGVAILFMLIGGISFNIHFLAWSRRNLGEYWRDAQVRTFLIIVILMICAISIVVFVTGTRGTIEEALRISAFEVVSVITTTGFVVDDFSLWPLALPVILIFSSFVGSCAGSTSGGMKVIRFMIVVKQASVHVQRLIHPQMVKPLKINDRVISEPVIEAIWAFFVLYVMTFAIFMVLLMMEGFDQVSAFGAVAACINNLGPGLGTVAANFADVSDEGKLLLAFAMLLGRLEIFTFLVLVTPSFWRR